jgi:ATP-dependent Clp protease ATP-binding subunit ClpA
MLSRNLEQTLHRALAHANERRHEYATLWTACAPN